MRTLVILFILTVMDTVKIPLLLLISNLSGLWILSNKPLATLPPAFNIHNHTIPETKKYSYWYHTKPDKQPPAELVDQHVSLVYWLELKFLDDENNKQPLTKADNTHCEFLCDIIDTYHHLASSNEPDIFNINQDQKHIFSQLFHFSSKDWVEHKKWFKSVATWQSRTFQQQDLLPDRGNSWNFQPTALTKLTTFVTKSKTPLKMTMLLLTSKRIIDYTRTMTFSPNIMTSTLVVFFYWPLHNTSMSFRHTPTNFKPPINRPP